MNNADTTKSRLEAALNNPWLIFLLILFVTIVCFSRSLQCDFVLDDNTVILKNELIKSWRMIPKLFVNTYWAEFAQFGNYRPISNLSFAIEYAFFGDNPLGYHLVSLLLHVIISFLVYWIINFYTHRKYLALIAALIFAVHPVHSEVVYNVAQRTELLSSLFILLGWICYCLRTRAGYYYPLSLFNFACALLAKETGILLFGVIILADICADWQLWWQNLRRYLINYIGYLAIIISYFVVRIAIVGQVSVNADYTFFKDANFFTRLFTMSQGIVKYLQLSIWPNTLCASYDFSWIPKATTITLPVALSLILLSSLIIIGLFLLRHNRLYAFAILFFFMMLSAVSNIIFISGILISERALYLAVGGICILAAGAIDWLINNKRSLQILGWSILIGIILLSGWRDYRRGFDWQDDDTFMNTLVQTAPNSPNALVMFANYCLDKNRANEAEIYFKRLIAIMPDRAIPYGSLGELYLSQGRIDEALPLLQQAVKISTNFASHFIALGKIYNQKGDYTKAAEAFGNAIKVRTPDAWLYQEYALALYNAGDNNRALEMFQRTLEIKPDMAEAHNNIGTLLRKLNRNDEAIGHFQKALKIDPQNGSIHNAYGAALLSQERLQEAGQEFITTINIDRSFLPAYNNLGIVYMKLHQNDEAKKVFEAALKIDPNYANALRNLEYLKAENSAKFK